MTTVPVAEIFGPTLQGEGALAGVPTYFLRVGGCDFKCVWCDSGHAVLPENVRDLPRLSPDEIGQTLLGYAQEKPGPHWLTISGGNPALYDLEMVCLAWHTLPYGGKIAVETQGTLWKPWLGIVDLLTISPKPPSSQMDSLVPLANFMEEVGDAWEGWLDAARDLGQDPNDHKVVLKVVVFDEEDYAFAKKVHMRYPLVDFYLSCGTASGGLSGKWVPSTGIARYVDGPQHVETELGLLDRYRWLAEKAMNDTIMADVVVLPQLHALTWGITTKGV